MINENGNYINGLNNMKIRSHRSKYLSIPQAERQHSLWEGVRSDHIASPILQITLTDIQVLPNF